MPAEIVFPSSLRAADSAVQFMPIDIARSVSMDAGEVRRRPRFRTAPQVASVSWRFDQVAFDAFWDWYEDELLAGQREFDVQLERQGGPGAGDNVRLQWWTAQFVEPPEHTVSNGYRYLVTARLMLLGAPFDARAPLGVRAASISGSSGGWRPTASPIAASGLNSSLRGWLYLAPGDSIRGAGANGASGGWAQVDLAIIASGANTARGGWTQPNGVLASGPSGSSGAWAQINVPIISDGTNNASGGWEV